MTGFVLILPKDKIHRNNAEKSWHRNNDTYPHFEIPSNENSSKSFA